MLRTLFVGVLGAVLGGLIASAVGLGGISSFFSVGTWLIAIGGALLLLYVFNAVVTRSSGPHATSKEALFDHGDSRRRRVTMPVRLATVLAAAALALVACGGGEEQAPEAQPPSDGGQPPAEQVLPTDEQLTGEELVRESAAVAESVARAARRLTEDPQADVADELARAQERARSLGAHAEWSRERPQRAEQVEQELGIKARLGLLRLNARTEAAARRLGGTLDVRPVKEQHVSQVARQALERLRDELSALRDVVPAGLRDRVDELSNPRSGRL